MTLTDNSSNKVNYIHNTGTHNFSAAEQVLPFLLKLKNIRSVLDIGCGTGTWLSVAKRLGVNKVLGIDGVDLNESQLTIPTDEFIRKDLTAPIRFDKKFDLVICLEVAEHLPETSAETLIDTLISHSDFILFSASVPGQDGQSHVNEQWPGYWQNLFLKKVITHPKYFANFFGIMKKLNGGTNKTCLFMQQRKFYLI